MILTGKLSNSSETGPTSQGNGCPDIQYLAEALHIFAFQLNDKKMSLCFYKKNGKFSFTYSSNSLIDTQCRYSIRNSRSGQMRIPTLEELCCRGQKNSVHGELQQNVSAVDMFCLRMQQHVGLNVDPSHVACVSLGEVCYLTY